MRLRLKLNKRTLIVSVASAASLIVVPATVAAQARPNPSPRNTPRTSSDDVLDMRTRELNIRRIEIEKDKAAKPTFEVSPEAVKLVNEDFARIQGINAEIIRDYVTGKPPDYKRISEAMAEMRKRAARLNTNLLLPPDEAAADDKTTQTQSNKQQTRSPLLDLNDLVQAFVTNPIFKNANTIDLTLGVKARRDLAGIIDLSERIRKSAEKLSKSSAKPN